MGWVIVFFLLLAVLGYIITGVVLLIVNFWWLIVPALLLACWWYYRHPGVKAKRQLRTAVKRGDEMREDIWTATEQAKAEMDRIARDWHDYR